MGIFSDLAKKMTEEEAARIQAEETLKALTSAKCHAILKELRSFLAEIHRIDIEITRGANNFSLDDNGRRLNVSCEDLDSFVVTGDDGDKTPVSSDQMARRTITWIRKQG